ncbi:MAG: Asp-tRNA(Asn)/Glu-tRNA(Gln) amidotransferase subunit GatC [Gammaproteobacteria bacterium]|nr:Asp-tRNA(Asn)/Glu-tRNA(Gln) amidotransferase subunit GatC [Gammaproteobacteria bacterium]MCW8840127.1 Asp-tRNA(Asn)/Glu-tRNA(Gln) amidotransferase subunit GatC [Gammaproteobacteria bacterium]MCW8959661.1 Asp-tRNA(Asn)/Glu-tRNA(Gln) amidotransferase subunit GatC [Gammaproteobacteria bacterium]MCW8972656.1 Asp-tRNA(Asn)/Glu-tRNA(Gln) amidotransferase subunit GatC [Gammaproteobacteria bacterium]MCW8992379.1 Asp-tRNA(Asn)/Glu-tRNA(Gln) amidotransferase subunit GatC [Gammaproteobacteria bacterium
MALDKSDVQSIAYLARMAISEEDVPAYAENLTSILTLVEQMSAVDTSGVEPMAHPLEMAQRLREDVVTEENRRDHFQQYAPAVENGLFLVPRVIE